MEESLELEKLPRIITDVLKNCALYSVDCASDCAYYCPCKNNLYFIYDGA